MPEVNISKTDIYSKLGTELKFTFSKLILSTN